LANALGRQVVQSNLTNTWAYRTLVSDYRILETSKHVAQILGIGQSSQEIVTNLNFA
jgi:hypothetical protein